MEKQRHYLVYQITNLINNKIYIGIHSTYDLNDGYMGSGSYLKRAIKKYGIENFQKDILFDFDNPEEMILKESELVDRKFIARKDVYNIKLGGEGWLTLDSISVKDTNGNCFRVHKDDPRWLSGELSSVNKGKVVVSDGNKFFSISVDYFHTGDHDLVSIVKGLSLYVDSNNNIYYVNSDDARIKTGELVSLSKNTISVKDNNGKYFRVKSKDPRYLSGELVAISKGRKHKEETKKKIGLTNSKYQKGSGNSQYGTCWIHNIELNENKKIKKEDIQIWLNQGWISGRKMKF